MPPTIGKNQYCFGLIKRKAWPSKEKPEAGDTAHFVNTTNGAQALRFSSDDKNICGYYSLDNNILQPVVWDAVSGENLMIPFANATNGAVANGFSSDDKKICGYYVDSNNIDQPVVWDAVTGKQLF